MWFQLNQGLSLSPTHCLPQERDAMMKRSIDRELRIRDFYGNILVEELKNETPLSIVTKLERKINEFSKIIEDMSSHAKEYRHSIMEARSTISKAKSAARDESSKSNLCSSTINEKFKREIGKKMKSTVSIKHKLI
ncbi:hypothetical protein CTI12_AA462680 [Artemisia annua]|uniref:Uncharacterized protein n=1 Tax=Artemisia annua TaxID=35608 RepID=A0A2U1LR99_ARTAN|nr:hypothetical protein CTI12_AA462680 [Artemisia annua]